MGKTEWRIESIGTGDLEVLKRLLGRTLPDPWSAAQLERALADSSLLGRIAWQRDAQALGFVLGRRILDLIEIDLVGVVPEARRRGVAASLITSLVDAERRTEAREAHLELRRGNAAALGLYEAQGFVVVGTRARYYPDGEDALLLTRVLSPDLPESGGLPAEDWGEEG